MKLIISVAITMQAITMLITACVVSCAKNFFIMQGDYTTTNRRILLLALPAKELFLERYLRVLATLLVLRVSCVNVLLLWTIPKE